MLRDSKHIALIAGLFVACGGASPNSAVPEASEASGRGHRHHHDSRASEHASGRRGHHHRFDDAASWSKVFDDPARDEWQKPASVVGAMEIAPGMSVADVGAGTGYFEPHLARAVGPSGKVVAVDIEPDMVRWIEARAKRENLANVEAVLGAPADPKLAEGKMDRILVVDTWHHIDDRPAYASRLASSLRPGGVVYIVDFTKESPHGPPAHARLSREEVSADLAAAGLSTREVPVGLPHQYVIAGARAPTLPSGH